MTVPDWIQDAVFYQIFPDRFANGSPANDPANVQPWGAQPDRWGYQGGDLQGIIEKFDYLLDLGVNAIYLNPIFHSTANHRYHILDYMRVDPILGGLDDFRNLLDLAHKHNVRLILDGVLNHCSRGFFAFADVLENGERSPYKDWYHIKRFPLNAYGKGKAQNYAAWWGIKDLPKFNTDNPAVRDYLLKAVRYWTELGIDGWRLDVPNEIDDDDFWLDFRHAVRSINPDAYLVGEIWDVNERWVNDTHFDGLMNYPLRDAILDVLRGKLEFSALTEVQAQVQAAYESAHYFAQYNLLGSHDTRRPLSILDGDLVKLKLAYATLFAFPGAPAIYYGDEIGMLGNREPESRGAFPWNEAEWNLGLRDWVKKLIGLRHDSEELRRGEFAALFEDADRKLYAFSRGADQAQLVFVANFSDQLQQLDLLAELKLQAQGKGYRDLLNGKNIITTEVRLEPFQARYLVLN